MPLQKQLLPIQIGAGVDTKTDPKKVLSTKLSVLENGVFNTPGRISKRSGYTSLGNSIVGGGNLTSANNVAAPLTQLFEFSDGSLFAYSAAEGAFINKGLAPSIIVSSNPIVSSFDINVNPDAVTVGNYLVCAYQNCKTSADIGWSSTTLSNSPNIVVSIQDVSDDTVIKQTAILTSPQLALPKTETLGSLAYVFSVDPLNTTLYCSTVTPSTSTISSPTTLATDIQNTSTSYFDGPTTGYWGCGYLYDTTVYGSQIALAYIDNTSIKVLLINSNLTIANSATFPITGVGTITRFNGLSLCTDTNGILYISFTARTSTQYIARYFSIDGTLTIQQPLTNIGLVSGQYFAITSISKIAGTVYFFITSQTITNLQLSDLYPGVISTHAYTATGGTVTTLGLTKMGGVCVASKPFVYNSKVHINLLYISQIQPAYFCMREDGIIPAQFARLTAGIPSVTNILPTPRLSNNTITVALSVRLNNALFNLLDYLTVGTGTCPPVGVITESLNFSDPVHNFITVGLGESSFTVGSVPLAYDGNNVFEHGLLLAPEIISTASSGSAGNLSVGTYQYFVTYEYIDNTGEVWRSPPSAVSTYNSSNNDSVIVTFSSLSMTDLQITTLNRIPGLTIQVYRTIANGSIAYRVTSQPFVYDSKIAVQQSYTDNLSDANAQNNPQLYTTGGVLQNDPPPPCAFAAVFDNRIFVGGLENVNRIQYSKDRVAGEPVQFSDNFTIDVDPKGGGVTALGRVDDKLIIFKRNNVFVMNGTGPTDTGVGSTYSVPTELVAPVGCNIPKSTVIFPAGPKSSGGLMFQSPSKGIWCINRSLEFQYIGAEVEAYTNSAQVTSAIVIENQNHIRFTMNSGIELVYDYFIGEWSVFTNISAVGSCIYNGNYIYATSNGTLYEETLGTFTDNGSAISLKIGTSWIKLTDLQNFQRIIDLLAIGDYKSPHTINGLMYLNYDDTVSYPFTFTPDGSLPYQWRYFPPFQKCESIKFVIADTPNGGSGESYNLSNFALDAALKPYGFKLRANQTTG